jgi:DNA-binding NarL/FixJ family response regulator
VDRPHPVRVLLADAHALTRSALGSLLASRPGLALVGEAATLAEACRLAEQEMPDVILLYLRPDSGISVGGVQPLLKAAGPAARVLLLADAAGADLHRRAVRVGAYGVVGTDRPPESLLNAIDKVHQGEVWMERRFVADLIGPADVGPESDHARIGSLTPREREVVGLLCEGLRNKKIADRLAVTDVTVRHHLTSVFSKLGVSDRLGLLLYASRHGLATTHTFVPSQPAHRADAGAPGDQ